MTARAAYVYTALSICALFLIGWAALAQSKTLSVTVTPPLIQLAIGPGESWGSSLKVVNNNPYDVTYYAEVVNFEAKGEDGTGDFMPLIDEGIDARHDSFSLARWVTISKEPIIVPRGDSKEIPFTIKVPVTAEPGGHYAAILVGTKPTPSTDGGPSMKISSYVSSLLFVKIRGDIVEKGAIREFLTDKTLYEHPQADFTLRFENKGNTHLRPQGDIVIYNMWGKERGRVLINKETSFGNVLPSSIRKFHFSWESSDSYFDIGRYSAVVTLVFGDGGKQNVNATTYFWVVPIVPVATVVASLIAFVLLILWLVKRYIRRALALERLHRGEPHISKHEVQEPQIYSMSTLMEPLKQGVIDLRAASHIRMQESLSHRPQYGEDSPDTFGAFLLKYRLFFVFIGALVVVVLLVNSILDGALESDRDFKISDIDTEVSPAQAE